MNIFSEDVLDVLENLLTETQNIATSELDSMSTIEIVKEMNLEDSQIAASVATVMPRIEQIIDSVVKALKNNGRLIYIGAGTSGRLGVLDAVECVPTFGTPPEMVQGILAGGYQAMFSAVEGSEDSAELGENDLKAIKLTDRDIVIGLTASGRTPYVIGAIKYATKIGANTAGITCNKGSELGNYVEMIVDVESGPEVLTGSTRLKAGTAQKLVLNMISTVSMIKLGKVYQNLMVDVHATNEKLMDRAIRIVCQATHVERALAEKTLKAADNHARTAIVMLKCNVSKEEATRLLSDHQGSIRGVLNDGLSD